LPAGRGGGISNFLLLICRLALFRDYSDCNHPEFLSVWSKSHSPRADVFRQSRGKPIFLPVANPVRVWIEQSLASNSEQMSQPIEARISDDL
jgi:hypothetical protein